LQLSLQLFRPSEILWYLEADVSAHVAEVEMKARIVSNAKPSSHSLKKSLEEEIFNFSHKQNDWLAPFQNWLKYAQSLSF